jgi:hypothetical protein
MKLVDLLFVAAQDRDALAGVEEPRRERAADVGRGVLMTMDMDYLQFLPQGAEWVFNANDHIAALTIDDVLHRAVVKTANALQIHRFKLKRECRSLWLRPESTLLGCATASAASREIQRVCYNGRTINRSKRNYSR